MNLIRRMLCGLVLMEEPEAPAAAAPTPEPVAPSLPESPWSQDLAALGLDETGLSAVDGYLREKIQPRMTQFEQELAGSETARRLYSDFTDNPQETFLAVGEQLFPEQVEALRQLFTPAEPEAPAAPAAQPAGMDPRLQAVVEAHERAEAQRHWDEQMAPLRQKDPHISDQVFSPFVVSAGGDFEKAYAAYEAFKSTVLQGSGWTAPAEPEAPAPPATLGSGTSGTVPPPPVQEVYASIEDALEATLAEARAKAPAVI